MPRHTRKAHLERAGLSSWCKTVSYTHLDVYKRQTLGYIHSVETFGLVDGPGVRYIIFLQGCAMRCQYCHNPETWAFTKDTAKTPQEAFSAAYRYRNYWRSNGGLTISGGEPLLQMDFVSEVFRLARAKKVQTALDTSCLLYTSPAGIAPLDKGS